MFDENKFLHQENKAMRNLIDCLADKDSLSYRLWQMDWTLFVTVSYKLERNKKSCFKQMYGLNEYLISKYGNETQIRIYFTTEPFNNRIGYHNHFVLYISNQSFHESVMNELNEYFNFDRVDITPYDKYKAGLFYMSKAGHVNDDWDIIGNDLEKEKISI